MKSLMEVKGLVDGIVLKYEGGGLDRGELSGVYEEVFVGLEGSVGGESHPGWVGLERILNEIDCKMHDYEPCPSYNSRGARYLDCFVCASTTCHIRRMLDEHASQRSKATTLNTAFNPTPKLPPRFLRAKHAHPTLCA